MLCRTSIVSRYRMVRNVILPYWVGRRGRVPSGAFGLKHETGANLTLHSVNRIDASMPSRLAVFLGRVPTSRLLSWY